MGLKTVDSITSLFKFFLGIAWHDFLYDSNPFTTSNWRSPTFRKRPFMDTLSFYFPFNSFYWFFDLWLGWVYSFMFDFGFDLTLDFRFIGWIYGLTALPLQLYVCLTLSALNLTLKLWFKGLKAQTIGSKGF